MKGWLPLIGKGWIAQESGVRSEARVGSARYAVRPQCWCWIVGKVWSMPVRSQVVKKVGLVAAADSIQTCACLNYKVMRWVFDGPYILVAAQSPSADALLSYG